MSGRRSHAGISSASSRLVIAFNSLLRRDVPNALQTVVIAIHGGEIVGGYVGADKVPHGFVLSIGQVTIVDAPGGATFTNVTAISTNGDIVGRYQDASNVFNGFLLVGFRLACVSSGS